MAGDGIARGGLSSQFYIVIYGGRSVLGHFQADYHLGGSRRGGLGGSDCICFFFFSKIISKIDQSEFDGFEYVNPLLMSQEDCV